MGAAAGAFACLAGDADEDPGLLLVLLFLFAPPPTMDMRRDEAEGTVDLCDCAFAEWSLAASFVAAAEG